MTDKVAITREEAIELLEALGLPTHGTNEELAREMHKAAARLAAAEEAEKVAAAEAREVAEDKRIVNAAIGDGRLPESRKGVWLDNLARNRAGTREVIAMLTPLPSFLRPQPKKQRRVAAAEPNLGSNAERVIYPESKLEQGRKDPFGFLPPGSEPVVLDPGKDPKDFTREEQYRAFIDKLPGLSRRLGVPKPPAGPQVYIPSPNDPYRWNPEKGHFEPKPETEYREI